MITIGIVLTTILIAALAVVLTAYNMPGYWLNSVAISFAILTFNLTDHTSLSWTEVTVIIVSIIINIIISLLDNFIMAKTAIKFGATKIGIIGAAIGAFLGGLLFQFIGIIVGTLIGASIAEIFFTRKTIANSIKGGIGASLGYILALVTKILFTVATSGIIIFTVIVLAMLSSFTG